MSGSAPARVLLVLDSLVPGGAERSTVDLLPELARRGFELELAVLHDRPGLHDEVTAAGVPIHNLAGPGGRAGWFRRLRRQMAATRPDLVHTSLFEADVCGRLAAATHRIPVLSTLTTEHYGSAHLGAAHLNRTKVRVAQGIDLATARLADRLHAVSNHVADTMAHRLRYPRDRIDVVYRGRPATMAALRDPRHRPNPLGPGPIVLVVARHEQAKGIDRAIAAFPAVVAAVPGATLAVAGRPGPHTAELTAMIDALDLGRHVQLLGHRSDIADLLAVSSALVLPSRREGLPGSLLEAMAAGTPVVVNGLPQVREVVGPEHTLIVDAADPAALAGGIVATLSDPTAARCRAGQAHRRFLDTFTLDRSADGMADIYERCLHQRRRVR